jgi:hypothetical protein
MTAMATHWLGRWQNLRLNDTQKVGLFAVIFCVLILIALHNPTDGYETSFIYTTPGQPMPPDVHKPTMTLAEADTKEKFDEVIRQETEWGKAYSATLTQYHEAEIDFLNWRSEGAFWPQIGRIKILFLFVVVLIAGGITWILIFRDSDKLASK